MVENARPALATTPELDRITQALMAFGFGPADVMGFRWAQHKASIKTILERMLRLSCYRCAQNQPVVLYNGRYRHVIEHGYHVSCEALILHKLGEIHGVNFTTRI